MMARLQRWQLLGRFLLAALSFALARGAGLGGAAALGVAAAVFWIHGIFMLGMFLGLLWLNRGEPREARAGVWPLLRAWWRELWVSERVFGWDQPFAAQAEPDFLPPAAALRGVLLLHGYTCNRGLWNGWIRRLREAGHPVIALTLEPAFGSIDAYADAVDAAVSQLSQASAGQPPLIVGHSMGGLVARAWLRRHGSPAAAHGIVTLGTPHGGSLWARFAGTQNGRQMRRSGEWLAGLAAAESVELPAYFDCLYSDCDHLICPAGSGVLPGARAKFVAGVGHLALVFEPQVFAHVMERLQQDRLKPRP